ncbi:hypothetical protein [Vibrio phage vB_VmeM-Yong XC32]|nr:hypothetical protein [Vibrio phage vB_VmeM-Yong XC31]QAX96545.1 hypothetical protein [Vibrio phage vB_VmeM-Yong XC32]QAX96863.1 hypothetical protein [Vibrio phage vB_VmeM-Yong MS31]QAX97168.1 hypothetical protein [Vibrio phage vB_VmeM-Yong MS32]
MPKRIEKEIELLDQYMLVFLFIYTVLGLICLFSGLTHVTGGGIFWVIGFIDAFLVWPVYYWHIKVKLPQAEIKEEEERRARIRKDNDSLVGQYLRKSLEDATNIND